MARLRPAAREPRIIVATIAPSADALSAAFRMQKTWNAKPGEIERHWYVVDAEGQTLGRLATRIADTLRGKRKPQYTPHVDTGDFVVVVNAEKIHVTGKKLDQKMLLPPLRLPGRPRSRTLREQLERRPTEVLRKAVKGMLPRTASAAPSSPSSRSTPARSIRTRRRRPKPLPLENGNGRASLSTAAPASARPRSRA